MSKGTSRRSVAGHAEQSFCSVRIARADLLRAQVGDLPESHEQVRAALLALRQLERLHLKGERRPVLDQNVAVAVEDLAARSLDRELTDLVVLSLRQVLVA